MADEPGEGDHSPGERSAKRALRAACKRRRLGLSFDDVATRSARIVDRLLPLCQRSQRVALFSPMILRREVDLRVLDATLRASGVAVYYPWQQTTGDGVEEADQIAASSRGTKLIAPHGQGVLPQQAPGKRAREWFRGVTDITTLQLHPLGFLQPADDAPIAETLDVIVVPALALTARGDRLGYGAGYYDRALARHPEALGIAVCYSFELVDELPTEPHDHRAAIVVTDEAVFDHRGYL